MRELKDRDLSENHRSGRTVWNPVKELKGGLVYALARRPRGEWNPEKELKVVESNLSHLSSLLRWNPEKELKDEARRGEQLHGWGPVESGEGIESSEVRYNMRFSLTRVESGEGIERSAEFCRHNRERLSCGIRRRN